MKLKVLSTVVTLSCVLGLMALSGSAFAQGGDDEKKVAICHRTNGDPPFVLDVVAESSVPAHLAHGDTLDITQCEDGTGGGGDPDPGAVPEPLTILLFGAGLTGVGYATRRLRKKGKIEDGQE